MHAADVSSARDTEYRQDTLVMIVADPDTRVYGDELVPVSKPDRSGADAAVIDGRRQRASVLRPRPDAHACRVRQSRAARAARHDAVRSELCVAAGRSPDVLLPNGTVRYFDYDRRTKSLQPAATRDPEMARTALANVLMPSWLYRDRLYRLAD
jgi:hypothetical protein